METHHNLLRYLVSMNLNLFIYLCFNQSNSLSLMWDQFYFNVDGTYTCIVYYLAEDNTARLESEQITVKLKGKKKFQ